ERGLPLRGRRAFALGPPADAARVLGSTADAGAWSRPPPARSLLLGIEPRGDSRRRFEDLRGLPAGWEPAPVSLPAHRPLPTACSPSRASRASAQRPGRRARAPTGPSERTWPFAPSGCAPSAASQRISAVTAAR